MAECRANIPDFKFNDRQGYESPADFKYVRGGNSYRRNKLLSRKPKRHKRDNKGLLESFFGIDLGLGI